MSALAELTALSAARQAAAPGQSFGAFLRSASGSGNPSGVTEKLGYGFYGTSPSLGYSQALFVAADDDVLAAACATGTVQMRPTPGYKASLNEARAWYNEAIMNDYLDRRLQEAFDVEVLPRPDEEVILGALSRVTLYLDPQAKLPLEAFADWDIPGRPKTGERIQFIAYRNLDPRSVFTALTPRLREFILGPRGFAAQLPADVNADLFAFYAFFAMNLALPVQVGDALGSAMQVGGNRTLGIEVWHRDGPIDPVHFFDAVKTANLMETEQSSRWDAIRGALSSNGKIFSSTVDSPRNTFTPPAGVTLSSSDFTQAIVPYPVLVRVRHQAGASHTSTEWRVVGDAQVSLYLTRLKDLMLLRRAQVTDPGRPGETATDDELVADEEAARAANPTLKPFRFNNADWRNVFQLEAVTAFYLNCPEPLNPAAVPRTDSTAATFTKVNLLSPATLPGIPGWLPRPVKTGACAGKSSDLYLVQIDDFRLVGGILPLQKLRGADWEAFDAYRGMMFIVKQGEIFGKQRFTSYTSRKHTVPRARCSIKGNVEYGFMSMTARGNENINYSFLVVNRGNFGLAKLEGRSYFDPPISAQEKEGIMIHMGYQQASGSEGCQVSDSYSTLRADVITAVLNDPTEAGAIGRLKTCYPGNNDVIADLETIRAIDKAWSADFWKAAKLIYDGLERADKLVSPHTMECNAIWEAGLDLSITAAEFMAAEASAPDREYVRFDEWDATIYGVYYLIRPAERHIGWGGRP